MALHTPSTPGAGSKAKTFFPESSHVAYQTNGNGAKSTMQAHILSLHTPSNPWVGSKGQNMFLLKIDMLHIKLNGMEHRAPCKHILCPSTHPWPLGGVKR